MTNHNDSQNSSSVLEFPEVKTLQTQASEWLAKLDAETASPRVLQDFKVWVNQDKAHRIAFEEMISFWDEINVLTQAVLPREQLATQPNSSQSTGIFVGWAGQLTQLFSRHSMRATAAALTVLAILITPIFWPQTTNEYITQVGEQKTIYLADQSAVHLNTNSRLEVDYSDSHRRLTLTQGQAHFDVAHNPNRPFEVYAGNGLVRAIGTAFTVHIRKVDVEVIVTEGTVELDHPTQVNVDISMQANTVAPENITANNDTPTNSDTKNNSHSLKVDAGNMLTYSQTDIDDLKSLVTSQIEKQLSWRKGMLVFKDDPLQKVTDEISRYTNLKIVIPERSTRELKVGGLFKIGDTESLFEALEESFGIHVQEVSENVVYLISNKNR
jgi:transmembrane sensor